MAYPPPRPPDALLMPPPAPFGGAHRGAPARGGGHRGGWRPQQQHPHPQHQQFRHGGGPRRAFDQDGQRSFKRQKVAQSGPCDPARLFKPSMLSDPWAHLVAPARPETAGSTCAQTSAPTAVAAAATAAATAPSDPAAIALVRSADARRQGDAVPQDDEDDGAVGEAAPKATRGDDATGTDDVDFADSDDGVRHDDDDDDDEDEDDDDGERDGCGVEAEEAGADKAKSETRGAGDCSSASAEGEVLRRKHPTRAISNSSSTQSSQPERFSGTWDDVDWHAANIAGIERVSSASLGAFSTTR